MTTNLTGIACEGTLAGTMRRRLLIPIVLVLALSGCGDDDDDVSTEATTVINDVTTTAPAAADCVSGDGVEVVVEASEFEFSPACVELTGDQSLVVKNVGSGQHTATIDGIIDSELEPGGQFASEAVGGGMTPGTYQLYCRFHRDSYGMEAEVRISA
jgi:plastocyanin